MRSVPLSPALLAIPMLGIASAAAPAWGAIYHVALGGSGDGSIGNPWGSLKDAVGNGSPVHVVVAELILQLPSPAAAEGQLSPQVPQLSSGTGRAPRTKSQFARWIHCRLWCLYRNSGNTKHMENQRSRELLPSILVIAVLVLAGACKKNASQVPPRKAASAPATATQKTPSPSAKEGSLPAGIDLSKLNKPQREVFDQVVNREASACGKGHSLLHSVKHDSSCRASFYAVRYVARLVASGFNASEISAKVEQRFRAPRVPYIDVSQAPSKGSSSGRVKIVEFADYQCTHCKEAQALLPSLLAEYSTDVTLYFKHFPLGGQVASLNAAIGAAAAQNQGKFWQFSDKVWENSERLSTALLESIAREIGLDFSRWFSEVGSEAVRAHVYKDRAEARELEIRRTPAFFINGRPYTDDVDLPGLKDWIDEELDR